MRMWMLPAPKEEPNGNMQQKSLAGTFESLHELSVDWKIVIFAIFTIAT